MKTFKETYLSRAKAIANLLNEAKVENSATNWSWIGHKPIKGRIEPQVSCSLYSGTAGVVYFLFELYKETNILTYKDAAQAGINHIVQIPNSFYQAHSYLTGSMGVACLLAEWGSYFNDQNIISASVDLVKGTMTTYNPDHNVDDYINGNAGIIHGLLKFQACLPEQQVWVTPYIERFVERLIRAASPGINGLCWDRTGSSIKPLCGFSHGAAGFGYLFLELGNFYKNKNFYWLAKEAFEYEDSYYNSQFTNWPDFRNGAYDAETALLAEEHIKNKNVEYFTQARDHGFAWCHGGPGVLLSRLRALDLLDPESDLFKKYTDQVNIVGSRMLSVFKRSDISRTKTLCHGDGGLALIFLDLFRFTNNSEYLQAAQEITNSIPLHRNSHQDRFLSGFGIVNYDEPGLFMGYAGIGYMFLKVFQQGREASILRPDVEQPNNSDTSNLKTLGLNEIIYLATERTYSHTFKKLGKEKVLSLVSEIKADDSISKLNVLIEEIKITSIELSEAYSMDVEVQKIDKSIFSFSYLSSLTSYHIKRNKEIIGFDDQSFDQLQFSLREFTGLYCLPNKKQNLLIYANVKESTYQPISTFTNIILNHFQKPQTIDSLIEKLTEEFEIDDLEQLKSKCRKQIKEVMQHGILIIVEEE